MERLSEMEFADFPNLEHLVFGADCCRNVKKLQMRNLGSLRVISMGDRSFYKTTEAVFYELQSVSAFTIGKKVLPALVNVKMECGWNGWVVMGRRVGHTSVCVDECL